MKIKHLIMILLPCFAIFMSGCQEDKPKDPDTLQVAPEVLSFAYDEINAKKAVTVTTSASKYSYTIAYAGDAQDWIEITEEKELFNVAVKSNNEATTERKATITVRAGDAAPVTVAVTQRIKTDVTDYSITLNPTQLSFGATGTDLTKTAEITTEGDGLTAKIEGGVTWFTASISEKTLTVTVTPNETNTLKEGKVVVTNAQGEKATLAVVQAKNPNAYAITLTPSKLTFSATGDNLTMTSTIKTNGTGVIANIDGDETSWIKFIELEGDILSVTVEENTGAERTGTITVYNAEEKTATLTVIQTASGDNSITITPTLLSFEASGTELSKTVVISTSGSDLSATADEAATAWITTAFTNKTLTITVTPNKASMDREGTVTIKNNEDGEATLTIKQKGIPVGDVSGTWNYSLITRLGSGNVPVTGTLTIKLDGSQYIVEGLKGSSDLVKTAEPKVYLQIKNGKIGVINKEAFKTTDKTYYFSANLKFEDFQETPWTDPNAFAELIVDQVEIDGVLHDRIVFPDKLKATPDLFPSDSPYLGEFGEASYAYYELRKMPMGEVAQPREINMNIVLTKPAN